MSVTRTDVRPASGADTASGARLLTLAALWGSSFTFIKMALEGLGPGQVVLVRLVLGAVLLVAYVRMRGLRLPRGRRTWVVVAGAALLAQVLPFLLLTYGEQRTTAAVAGTVIGATPLLTMGLATVVVPDERMGARATGALVAGFVGVLLVLSPWRAGGADLTGGLMCLGAAASYACGFVYVRRFVNPLGLQAAALAATQLVCAALLQAAVTPLTGWQAPHLTPRVVLAVVVLGALGTGAAYILYFRLIADLGATTTSTVNYVVPVMAVVMGVLVLGEPLTWELVVGGAVVLAAVLGARARRA